MFKKVQIYLKISSIIKFFRHISLWTKWIKPIMSFADQPVNCDEFSIFYPKQRWNENRDYQAEFGNKQTVALFSFIPIKYRGINRSINKPTLRE
jgi:hypothetical protein